MDDPYGITFHPKYETQQRPCMFPNLVGCSEVRITVIELGPPIGLMLARVKHRG
jgi:hypothetical protein